MADALPEYDLTGRTALVTGAGRGIAGGVARVLAEAGCDVALNALTPTHVEPLAAAIAAESGRRAIALPGDMTDPAGAAEVVERALAELGHLDVLVCGVGDAIAKPLVPLPNLPSRQGRPSRHTAAVTDEELRLTVDLNLTSALLCARAVGPHMLERGSGAVITIGSFAGRRGGAGTSLYAAGKSGTEGFTRALALEWAPYRVRVNGIAPGSFPDVVTAGDDGYRRMVERGAETVPLGRVGELREVGLLAAYLASDAAAYMTGQTLYLDGGMTL